MQKSGKEHRFYRSLCARGNCCFTFNSSEALSSELNRCIISISFPGLPSISLTIIVDGDWI